MSKQKKPWQPLQRTELAPLKPELLKAWCEDNPGKSEAEVRALIDAHHANCEYWINDIYQVEFRRFDEDCVQLNIRRRDGDVIFRDWRHFQRIKNELLGSECEAVELYPAESRLVDTSNKYHLWGYMNPELRFPFGMDQRDVRSQGGSVPGLRQRPTKEGTEQ